MKFYYYLIYVISFTCFSQKTNYLDYHVSINKAEELFFMEEKADSSLFYYEKAFREFDFIFVKDLINASQIAIFSNKPYQKYIERGFNYGLKLSHLEHYPLFEKEMLQFKSNKKLLKKYEIARKKYLSKIDFEYLDWVYKTAIRDQKEKRKPYSEYGSLVHITTDQIFEKTIEKGFPGDKVLGLADSLIFKEVNKPWLDLYEQRKNHKELFYMTSDDKSNSSIQYPIVMLVHNGCSFYLYEKLLLDELKKGNIHPREVGLLYDNQYRYLNYLPKYCENIVLKGVYKLNLYTEYEDGINLEETNLMRKELYIVSTYVDDKKKEYESKHGFKMFSGFWNCR